MKKIILILLAPLFFVALPARAERGRQPASSASDLSYDITFSVGTYDKEQYSEVNLGLNWYLQNWLIWRNALFSRFGSNIDSVTGLDTSMRFAQNFRSSSGTFGLDMFAGPGLRFASQNSNAVFGEAGLAFKLGGLYIGGGLKSLYYMNERKDSAGNSIPRNDNLFFIILAGGGTL